MRGAVSGRLGVGRDGLLDGHGDADEGDGGGDVDGASGAGEVLLVDQRHEGGLGSRRASRSLGRG